MEAQYIDYDETRCFSATVNRLLAKDERIKPFINQFPALESFQKIISQRRFNGNRPALVEVLNHQYKNNDISRSVKENIDALKNDNTFTVTTGHQLNIFTGPLYFIFKIVTAINLAKDLRSAFPENNFVPVYWMATEDHDFEEINHTYLAGKKIEWKNSNAGATGRLSIKTIIQALNNYKGVLGISENAQKLSEIVSLAYADDKTLAEATRYLANELFGSYGLIIIDADDKTLKSQFANIIEQDIIEQNSFKNIEESTKKLAKIEIHAQVNPREINFFYLTDDLRERIVFEDNKYQVLNTEISFSEDELKGEIKQNPERFSPNVVMRPLYQEVILPNLAYIGGGGELAYWLQLKSNFDFYKIDFPLLVLRNSAMIVDEKSVKKLHKLNMAFADAFEQTEVLKKNYVENHSKHTLDLKTEWASLQTIFDDLKVRVYKIEPTLKPSTEAVEVRLKKAIDSLEKKLMRAEKRNFAEAMTDIEKIKDQLFPGGGLQERKENFGLFYVKYGDDFISNLINHFKPLGFKFTVLFDK
ncbi:bacillithiol biosynthesis cysteine-adding enzyme BshC [Pedobacter sp. SD-b]|uniref:Putative cysteine ligase BshC n=1 Tax=Pedobacter segetis TaxID=2793069 RepID=A0ABS1BKI0_9SPHI|nr:bacillithiol biosynthesis cysteine-adding enzyme BshC [Pedobacter segetis]MBK0383403.1 bacillithiol biosynthesis cysteine-adding enzyme BshC [Pedobacter segetis]